MKQENSYIKNLYDDLNNIPKERSLVKLKVLNSEDPSYEHLQSELQYLVIKKEYLEATIQGSMQIIVQLREIKKDPKKSKDLKGDISPKKFSIFKKNLKPHHWVPAPFELCATCGKTQSETVAVATIISPTSGILEITCSRCLKDELLNLKQTKKEIQK